MPRIDVRVVIDHEEITIRFPSAHFKERSTPVSMGFRRGVAGGVVIEIQPSESKGDGDAASAD
jgi:hypothetical protein